MKDTTINEIWTAFNKGVFKNYIEYIRFPKYKNLDDNTRIDFTFPLTVLVGPNGSGKSSALIAIQGCPENESPGKYWFSTIVDPIKEGNGLRNSLVYGYKNNSSDDILEVIKIRIADIKYQREQDLWETSRPLVTYGMKSIKGNKRNPPIKKKLVYLDFRSQLSSFDKFFFFGDFKTTKNINTKQQYIRRYSKHLNYVIETDKIITLNNRKRNQKPISIDKKILNEISKILGKPFDECKLITHDLYKSEGTTIKFKTSDIEYSDAFAGRGEYAVVKLVHEIAEAENYALVVLDEPEVSLHPGAQRRMLDFILNEVKKKQLQVVISTHSPEFISGLPKEAIKVMQFNSITNKFSIKSNIKPEEAFYFIDYKFEKSKIIVEDRLSKYLIEQYLKINGEEKFNLFEVQYYPNPNGTIKHEIIPVYSKDQNNKVFIVFDGDQEVNHFDPTELIDKNRNVEYLFRKIKEQTNEDVKFLVDSNKSDEQKISLAIKYLTFYYKQVFYLPGNCIPEELIWDENYAKKLLSNKNDWKNIQTNKNGYKSKFKNLASIVMGNSDSESIFNLQKLFITNFLNTNSENRDALGTLLSRIVELTK